jgi:alpha-L-rhamnosidase
VALDQRADGCVANSSPCSPAEGFDGSFGPLHGSAGWGDAVVSVPWDLYEAYGDASLLGEMWDVMTAWVGFAADAAAGGRHPDRVAARPVALPHERYLWDTGFHWGEWLEPGGAPSDFGAFVRADGTLAVQSQTSHVRALAFGLVPAESRPAVASRLAGLVAEAGYHLTTGFLSTSYLLPVLAEHGYLDLAYDLLRQDTALSWLTLVDRGATTVWELWEGVDGRGAPHASLNHYSKGTVASFLHRYVAGLRPVGAGYRTFEVRPLPGGGITWASARHISPFGPIEVSWQLRDGAFELDVLVPPGTTASVVLPGEAPRDARPGRHHWAGAAGLGG